MSPRLLLWITAVALAIVPASGCGAASSTHAAQSGSPAKRAAPARSVRAQRAAADAQYAGALTKLAARGLPVYCGGRARPWVALTFDDGPGVYTKLADSILSHAHVPATFFLVGRNLALFHSALKVDERVGSLGDHSWTHPDLALMSAAAAAQQIASTKTAIEKTTHRRVMVFRPPYGARNAAIDAAARRLGLVEVLWTIDSADSLGANYAGIARNVIAGLHPGSIILMHENRGQTIRALKFTILPKLRRSHLIPVTLPQLLAEDPPTPAQLARGPRGCGGVVGRSGS